MLGDKFRFRFSKSGALRLVSHHDLMRCSERMLRRASLPFKSTAGFHPTPRWVFALSAPLGAVCHHEVVELELTEPRDAGDVLAALNAQTPPGLTFTHVQVVPMKATARPRRVVYELPLPPARAAAVEAAAAALMAEPGVWVERLKPSPKRLNIRPYLRGVRVDRGPNSAPAGHAQTPPPSPPSAGADAGPPAPRLVLDLWVTQTGSARADELLSLLRLKDLIDAGAVLERTAVEIRDEITATDPGDVPPDGPADAVPLSGTEAAALAARLEAEESQTADQAWGASPNGPVVE
ncbi:TIGR03936 family radical SAM-associated protein [Gemmata sp. JC717]|uniref:TIGR03936 family radical SAM-associated protein n=1 Tax=Gemmata algarum TaxID=2975278 RepID=UPI0021BB3F17|nr:TIGR03936 family radical SAM-associated protein [Gemmata algarum]MDY3551709.1 TIGR03936 family radical SAM-associated protein [Gemmata algarum]